MRTIVIEVETDSEDSLSFIKKDIEQELSCCSTYFDSIKITEGKVGKWIHDDFGYHCSECWTRYPNEITDELNYCPNCGARMKGEEDE